MQLAAATREPEAADTHREDNAAAQESPCDAFRLAGLLTGGSAKSSQLREAQEKRRRNGQAA